MPESVSFYDQLARPEVEEVISRLPQFDFTDGIIGDSERALVLGAQINGQLRAVKVINLQPGWQLLLPKEMPGHKDAWAAQDTLEFAAIGHAPRAEAMSGHQLRHPNLLHISDFGTSDDGMLFYMVSEYCAGGSLRQRLNRGPLSPREGFAVIEGVGSALDYSHQNGVIHRDVKPDNIYLRADGRPVLADLGIHVFARPETWWQNVARTEARGSANTASPEHFQPETMTDKADQYSLACVAYQLFSGQEVFTGADDWVMHHHRYVLPQSFDDRTARPNNFWQNHVQGVVLKGLSKEPSERFSSTGMFVFALRQAFCNAFVGEGLRLQQAGQLEQADQCFSISCQYDPNAVRPYYYKATQLQAQGMHKAAQATMKTAAEQPGSSPEDVACKGYALARLGRHEAALHQFRIAELGGHRPTDLYSFRAWSLEMLADSAAAAGRPADAIAAYRAAAEIHTHMLKAYAYGSSMSVAILANRNKLAQKAARLQAAEFDVSQYTIVVTS